MKTSSAIALSAFAAVATAVEPVVYICGDSTMALGGGGTGTQGWGEYLGYSLNLTVANVAKAGRSARSYTREGRFDTLAEYVEDGDFVIIEFGHNDGGSLTPTDNGRTDCPGDGAETCSTTYDGVAETVLTYPAYLENAAKTFQALGATVIFASPTPDNPWETGTFSYTANRFTTYVELAATVVSGESVDHGQYVANEFETLGATAVDAFYPNDHTHTSPEGADVVAAQFVKSIVCAGSALAAHVVNSTSSLVGTCI